MDRKNPVLIMLFHLLVLAGWLNPATGLGKSVPVLVPPVLIHQEEAIQKKNETDMHSLTGLNATLLSQLQNNDLEKSRLTVERIVHEIAHKKDFHDEDFSASNYLLGTYYLIMKKYGEAIRYLKITARIKEDKGEYDERYAKTLYNIGIAYNGTGDFVTEELYATRSLAIEKKLYGDSSPLLIKTYFSLIVANIGLQEYERSLEYSKIALDIAGSSPEAVDLNDLASIYNNLGVLYLSLADYTKARVYLEKTESIYKHNNIKLDVLDFTLLNNLAITYGYLGLTDKSKEYYEKGIDLAQSDNSSQAYNYISSYAIALGNSGNTVKGEALLKNAMLRAKSKMGENSPEYFLALFFYAEFLRDFNIDNKKALEYYGICLANSGKSGRNLFFSDPLKIGYASSLSENGDNYKALEVIQSLLFSDGRNAGESVGHDRLFVNPSVDSLKAGKMSLNILRLKYKILRRIYNEKNDLEILETTSSTAKLVVEVLEKVRINISEEDSRLILGDRYRDSYLNAIRDFNILYRRTGDPVYIEEAFKFSEKSKVAGLLTATREMNASQFSIPSDLSDLEKKLKRDISFLSARIDKEITSEHPDTFMIQSWREDILKNTEMKDSLIAVFEKKYPGYYSFKYNTEVTKLHEVPGLIGRDANYINYVASDSELFIFIVNRKKQALLLLPADSSLFADIREFRKLLAMPSPSENAREAFDNYQKTGYRLYQKIIEPIMPYLISKKIIISPDNILSYIPFETIPTSIYPSDKILYSKIHYLMKEFDISYTYSVTFMAESMNRETRFGNRLIAFAPNYSDPIDIGSVLMNRQLVNGVLPDLPYAKQEAEYVAAITNGKLYENENASETVYKSESGKFDIIHLAMHTILNDKDPMYSTLIFSSEKDSTDDRYLKTYEVYSIPLQAKMVVLSSCNSGSGVLYSGEGILSLARGFMYSGSKSIVMAMWEIEDRSGTEIVKGFYDNLKKGYTKSSALRKARIHYLKQSDQLRSHPYFWSALVVYGNNSPLYYTKYLIELLAIAGISLAVFLGIYFWRRRYS
jgi:CHAT domain-containing protein